MHVSLWPQDHGSERSGLKVGAVLGAAAAGAATGAVICHAASSLLCVLLITVGCVLLVSAHPAPQVVVLVDDAYNPEHRTWIANHVLYKTKVTYLKVLRCGILTHERQALIHLRLAHSLPSTSPDLCSPRARLCCVVAW